MGLVMGYVQSFINALISIAVMLTIRSPIAMAGAGFLGGIYLATNRPETANKIMDWVSRLTGSIF
jgi:hypothetical protein